MYFKNLTIIFCFFHFSILSAQDYIYKNYNTSHGLSSSEVYDITQDKKGYLWFATDRGMTRYDGYEFKKYSTKDGLTDSVVFNFYEQKDGTILCSTYNKKIFFYDPDQEEFIPYSFNHLLNNIPKNYTFNTIKIDDKCSVFINFKGISGYIEIDDGGIVHNKLSTLENPLKIKFEDQSPFRTYVINETINSLENSGLSLHFSGTGWYYGAIHKSSKDRLITTVNRNINITDLGGRFIQQFNFERDILIAGELDEDLFWVGFNQGGAKVYDYNGRLVSHLLPRESVTKVLKDHEGGLWLATINSGVFYIKNPKIKAYLVDNKNQNVHSLTSNLNGVLYVGYENGELYKKRNSSFKRIWKSPYRIPHNRVKVQFFSKDSILLFQSTPLLLKDELGKITGLEPLNNGYILSDNTNDSPLTAGRFIIEYQKDIQAFNKEMDFGTRIFDIEHADEGYYLATLSGLYCYRKDSLIELGKKAPLLSYRIDDIDRDGDRYYLATMGGGLVVKNKDTIYSINTKNGLTSNSTTQVYVPSKQEVYVASNTGFNKILFDSTLTNYTVSNFSFEDGLPSNEVNDIELLNDTLWIATKNGLYSLPKELLNSSNQLLNEDWLQINKVSVNNDQIKNFDSVRDLLHYQNTIAIGFNTISFKNKENILYRYRLLGKENEWNTTKNKQIRYLNLNPGDYIFEVQSKVGNKTWNPKSSYLNITIRKPFWKTGGFYTILLILTVFTVYIFFRINVLKDNKDIIREFLRIFLRKVKGEKHSVVIKESGLEIKINTSTILYVKSAGNYLEIYTQKKMYLVREKIGNFEKKMPDQLEFMRVHRSYLIRIDKIEQKNHKFVVINDQKIPVSSKYKENMDKIIL